LLVKKYFYLALSVLDLDDAERLVKREKKKKFLKPIFYCLDIYFESEVIAGPLKFVEFCRSLD